jgi:hypothetical protein
MQINKYLNKKNLALSFLDNGFGLEFEYKE